MVQAQEWLDKEYPNQEAREKVTKLNISNQRLERTLNLNDFINLEELECYDNKLTKLVVRNCPKLERICCSSNELNELEVINNPFLKELNCSHNKILVTLDLSKNQQLEKLSCSDNQLTELILPNLPKLDFLSCFDNCLTNLDFLTQLNPNKLEKMHIRDNNFPPNDLSVFSSFINLKKLNIGNHNQQKMNQGIYNCFIGSLEPLKNLTELEMLFIENTDLNSGLEYLPESLTEFICSSEKRPEALVSKLKKELKVYGEPDKYDNHASLLKKWQENHPHLILNAKKINELELILNNLNLALTKSKVEKESIKKCLAIFIFETQSQINGLRKQNQGYYEAQIQITPKSGN